jgi:hypothetical protein
LFSFWAGGAGFACCSFRSFFAVFALWAFGSLFAFGSAFAGRAFGACRAGFAGRAFGACRAGFAFGALRALGAWFAFGARGAGFAFQALWARGAGFALDSLWAGGACRSFSAFRSGCARRARFAFDAYHRPRFASGSLLAFGARWPRFAFGALRACLASRSNPARGVGCTYAPGAFLIECGLAPWAYGRPATLDVPSVLDLCRGSLELGWLGGRLDLSRCSLCLRWGPLGLWLSVRWRVLGWLGL